MAAAIRASQELGGFTKARAQKRAHDLEQSRDRDGLLQEYDMMPSGPFFQFLSVVARQQRGGKMGASGPGILDDFQPTFAGEGQIR